MRTFADVETKGFSASRQQYVTLQPLVVPIETSWEVREGSML